MKIIKYLLPVMLLLSVVNVKAIDACTTEEMNRLRELANNVQFKTDYELYPKEITNESGKQEVVDMNVIYKIQLINDNEDLKYYYKLSSWSEKYEITANELANEEFYNGDKLEIYIYSYTTNLCTDELLKKEVIKLPSYNLYYYLNKDKCKKNPTFKYCKEFMDVNISSEEIDKQYEEYVNKNATDKVSNIILDNIYYIIGGVIILIILVISIILIKKRKKRLDI